MNRIIRIIAICGVLAFTMPSCGDDGDSVITDFQLITEAADADNFLQSIYELMRSSTLFVDGFVVMPMLFTDNATYTGTTLPDWTQASDIEIEITNSTADEIFTELYNINGNISVLLAEVDTSVDISFTPDIRAGFLAEGRAIRGFVYYYLNQLWGNVPLILDEEEIVDSLIPNSTPAELFAQIESDLVYAAENISRNGYIDGDQGRLDEAAIKTLLARFYLSFGENQDAFDVAEDVILNSGFNLEPNVSDVYANLNSEENLWRITENSSNISLATYFLQPFFNGQYVVRPRAAIDFETDDARRNVALSAPGTTILKYDDILNNTDPVYMVRLAETYLIAAEAAARLNNFDDASTYLNDVRNRADLDDLTLDAGNWEAAILNERNAELCYEGIHRLSDLRRFGQAEAVLGEFGYESKDDLWPYSERILDAFGSLEQNDGY